MATDPVAFISRYAQGWGPISMNYISNPYLGVRVLIKRPDGKGPIP